MVTRSRHSDVGNGLAYFSLFSVQWTTVPKIECRAHHTNSPQPNISDGIEFKKSPSSPTVIFSKAFSCIIFEMFIQNDVGAKIQERWLIFYQLFRLDKLVTSESLLFKICKISLIAFFLKICEASTFWPMRSFKQSWTDSDIGTKLSWIFYLLCMKWWLYYIFTISLFSLLQRELILRVLAEFLSGFITISIQPTSASFKTFRNIGLSSSKGTSSRNSSSWYSQQNIVDCQNSFLIR